ncbi:hypothetical protein [Lutibacter sp.]|uniref:hypothetical protein n=1 Tax=Lutibacter sp. TaxID=1925666 RepID=UPI002733F17C|nr:hypothetical protein [Lutibacter sp.]MDP3311877.1 hypothetical protein [Lutibacter sp.]
MKLIFKGTEEYIKQAVDKVNDILLNPAFYESLSALPQMENTQFSSNQISEIIKNSQQEIQIVTYKPLNPFSKVNATTINEGLIKVNLRRFSHDLKEGVNTLIHESVHAIDLSDDKLDFTHSSNYPKGQEKTAPWIIGELSEKFI